jgi:hypothetical protein
VEFDETYLGGTYDKRRKAGEVRQKGTVGSSVMGDIFGVIAVQDKPGRDERSLKAGRLGSGIERFQGEASMSGFCEPVQVIRE